MKEMSCTIDCSGVTTPTTEQISFKFGSGVYSRKDIEHISFFLLLLCDISLAASEFRTEHNRFSYNKMWMHLRRMIFIRKIF
jgi:hypothetical protein